MAENKVVLEQAAQWAVRHGAERGPKGSAPFL